MLELYKAMRRRAALLKAYCIDRWLGIDTSGYIASPPDSGLLGDSTGYQPSSYRLLSAVANGLDLQPDDVVIDLGCGKGRAVFLFARRRIKKVIGVEQDAGFFEEAQNNLRTLRRRGRARIELVHTDVASLDPVEGTVFYMFNPFGERTLERVLDNIRQSLERKPRPVRIVYYAPFHRYILDRQPWLEFAGTIKDSSCLMWKNRCLR